MLYQNLFAYKQERLYCVSDATVSSHWFTINRSAGMTQTWGKSPVEKDKHILCFLVTPLHVLVKWRSNSIRVAHQGTGSNVTGNRFERVFSMTWLLIIWFCLTVRIPNMGIMILICEEAPGKDIRVENFPNVSALLISVVLSICNVTLFFSVIFGVIFSKWTKILYLVKFGVLIFYSPNTLKKGLP